MKKQMRMYRKMIYILICLLFFFFLLINKIVTKLVKAIICMECFTNGRPTTARGDKKLFTVGYIKNLKIIISRKYPLTKSVFCAII